MPDWPHAPTHRFIESGSYMVTAATYQKAHHFRSADRLGHFQNCLLELAGEFGWNLDAWAVFSNHYHWVGTSPESPENLSAFINKLHTTLARFANQLDGTEGRKVWYQYWDTALTFEQSYFARLNYVIHNPVHHGLVQRETDYRWCSATWFECHAKPVFVKTVRSFKIDRLKVYDPFEPILD